MGNNKKLGTTATLYLVCLCILNLTVLNERPTSYSVAVVPSFFFFSFLSY